MFDSIHAPGDMGNDYTLCGYANEGNPGDAESPPPVIAKVGDVITCKDCVRLILYCQTQFTKQSMRYIPTSI